MGNETAAENQNTRETNRCGMCACRTCVREGKGHNRNVREPKNASQQSLLLGPEGGVRRESVGERLHQLTKSSSLAPYSKSDQYERYFKQ